MNVLLSWTWYNSRRSPLFLAVIAGVLAIVIAGGTALSSILFSERSSEPRERRGVFEADFNEYRGSEATLPDGMFVTAEDGDGRSIGEAFYPFTGAHLEQRGDNFSGFGAFTSDERNYSFGIRERGDVDLQDSRLFLEFENEFSDAIVGFIVSYDVEAWMRGERDNRIRLKYHSDTSGFSAIDSIISTSNPAGAADGEDREYIDGSRAENRTTVRIGFMLDELTGDPSLGFEGYDQLAPGETGYLRWQYSNDEITDGSLRSALALNNIRVEPVFEGDTDDAEAEEKLSGSLTFSRTSGFHDDPGELHLNSSLEGADIYYTLDGSVPDPDFVMSDEQWSETPRETRRRTFHYNNAIDVEAELARANDITDIPTSIQTDEWAWSEPSEDVNKAAVVRAVAISDHSRSTYRAESYFRGGEKGENPHDLPVWSILTNRENLFDPDIGIYVPGEGEPPNNYRHSGREWEREAHMEFFENGDRTMRQDLGIRIHGGFSRSLPQKSLRLYSRSDYGTSRLNNRFFDSKEMDDFNRLLLRNGGNEWYRTMLADPVMQTLVEHLNFDTQHHRPSVLYINGEYWGIHKIRDRYDHHYVETHYDIPRDEVAIVEHLGSGRDQQEQVHTGDAGDNEPFIEFRQSLTAGEITSREEVEEHMVLDGWLDYIVAQVYAGNYDWPQNNQRYWRYTGDDVTDEPGPRDGRWRWTMHDLTRSFGHDDTLHFNMVEWIFGDGDLFHPFYEYNGHYNHEQPFEFIQALIAIDEIREALLGRFGMHLSTTLSPERASSRIDTLIDQIEHEVPRHIERWNAPETLEEWWTYADEMYEAAELRPSIVRQHLSSHFDEIDGEVDAVVHTAGEDLVLNSVVLGENTPGITLEEKMWSGTLFAGVPVVLESEERDLSETRVTPEEHVSSLERSSDRIRFIPSDSFEIHTVD